MAEVSIPVDPDNPGQVFACLGLMEIAEILLGEAEGAFELDPPERFVLRARGEADPVAEALRFLVDCEVRVFAPSGESQSCGKDSVFAQAPARRQGRARPRARAGLCAGAHPRRCRISGRRGRPVVR